MSSELFIILVLAIIVLGVVFFIHTKKLNNKNKELKTEKEVSASRLMRVQNLQKNVKTLEDNVQTLETKVKVETIKYLQTLRLLGKHLENWQKDLPQIEKYANGNSKVVELVPLDNLKGTKELRGFSAHTRGKGMKRFKLDNFDFYLPSYLRMHFGAENIKLIDLVKHLTENDQQNVKEALSHLTAIEKNKPKN